MPHGVTDDATIGFDADGLVMSASAQAAAALGYSNPDELEGRTLSSLINESADESVLNLVHSDDFTGFEASLEDDGLGTLHNRPITFVRKDGTTVRLEAIFTPETSGGWITLMESETSATPGSSLPGSDITGILRRLADGTGSTDSETEIAVRFSEALRDGSGADSISIVRSTGATGLYETLATANSTGIGTATAATDLPPALIPGHGKGAISVDALESLALFDPVVVAGQEATGAYMAVRTEYQSDRHILIIATSVAPGLVTGASLLLETGALILASVMRNAEVGGQLASVTRTQDAVRRIGTLASQDLDGGFLEAARKIIERRLPVSIMSIHVADPTTARCYVAATSSEDTNGLAPSFEWPLAGSIEHRVIRSGMAQFISPASPERVSVPPATAAQWRAAGLQTVVAIPLREAGQVIAVMLAGFSSALTSSAEAISLLESITPAVHLGIGLSATRPSSVPEPDETDEDPGFVPHRLLLAITRAAAESPDTGTLFASVNEWLLEIIPGSRLTWGTINHVTRTYQRLYNYDTESAGRPDTAIVSLDDVEYESLEVAALKAPEPGHAADKANTMRVAVCGTQGVLAIVTAWQRDDEPFTSVDLARMQRICEFIAGPLERILESAAARETQRMHDAVIDIGLQAAGFTEPALAFRAVRPQLSKIFPHDRALYIEMDRFAGAVNVPYDSAMPPGGASSPGIPLAALPSTDIITTQTPLLIALERTGARRTPEQHLFAQFRTFLAVPVCDEGQPIGALILMAESADTLNNQHKDLAKILSSQLSLAHAGWDAHRSTRQSSRELSETRKQLNLLLESAPVALISTDPNGVCTRLEGHGLEKLGIKRDQMIGKSVFELTGKLPQLEDAIRQALRGIPASVVTSMGTYAAEVWAQPITERDGTVKGITLIGYDISDSVRNERTLATNRKLRSAGKDRMRFVNTVSHDLRNPLQSIISYTEILAMSATEQLTQRQAHILSIIQNNAEQLNGLIDDLFILDTGNYSLELFPVNVGGLMRKIVDAQLPIFETAGQTLTLSLPDDEYTVEADQLRLTRVVTNLLSNASKYSPPKALIELGVEITGTELKLSVTDNGPGIPEEIRDRVFDPGTRGPNAKVSGSGLGLYITSKIVELHGGTVSIDSQEGAGTTVNVTSPGAQRSDTRAKTTQPASKSQAVKPVVNQPKRRRQNS